MSTSPFLNVFEVAERWRCQPRSVRDVINRNQLRATKIGGQWLVRLDDVEAFEKAQMNVRPTAKRTRPPRRRAG